MLATFNGAWDWTAIGTLALAAVTLAAVIVAAIALRQTRADIALSRKEVEETHRPVVVPVLVTPAPATASVSASRHTLPTRPSVVEPGVLAVPVENIGSGPALDIVARAELLLIDGTRAGHGGEPTSIGTLALGSSALTHIEIHTARWTEGACFALTLTYADVAGKRWTTTARYFGDPLRYEDVTISPQTGGA